MKQEVSRLPPRGYRRGAGGTCCICNICRSVKGQRHCVTCHALYQRFWRAKTKARRGLDDDVKMVELGLQILRRRLGIGVTGRRHADI